MRAELFKFTFGTTEYNYTNIGDSVSYNGDTYTPAAIGHGKRDSRTDANKTVLEVSLDIFDPLSAAIMQSTGDIILTLTMFVHTDTYTEIVWKGKLTNRQPRKTELLLSIESLFTSLKRPGLSAKYQRNCRHALYEDGCYVNKNSFLLNDNVSAISDSVVTVPIAATKTNGYYIGGMIKDATTGIYRLIIQHVGADLTLVRNFESLSVGSSVDIFPGCPHTIDACLNTFNNIQNYGGFPWLPTKNPFGGSSIV